MKYQNNKDLAEAQYYLKMLDDFCKSGQVKIPDPTGTAMPWNLKEDPLKDYLIHLFTLKVTIPETGEEVQKFVRQVVNSKIKSKVFYDCVGKFIVECVHHMRFQRQRAWTESHRADDVLDWTPFKRMDEQVWLPLIDQLEQEHQEDGFDKSFFLKLMAGDGASKPENWERLVRDWKVCIDHQVLNKLKDFISLRQNNFETGLVRMMDQITRNMKTKGVSEQRAVQAWELMTNGWTETEFERRLNQVKIQDKYPEIKEIVAKMGRVADANGKDRLTIASGVEMKMEHSAGSDIEGITVGDDLNSLLPLELAQYSDEDMEGLFIYKYRTRRL
ncbi:MAG: kinase, partial [Segatella copri]